MVVIGFGGNCEGCSYQQLFGVGFTPSRPCDPCRCSLPTRRTGHGAGSGSCCEPETDGTGCLSDERPDCDTDENGNFVGYSSGCIYDGGYEGGCIQLGFGEAPSTSCTDRLVGIQPDHTYRVTFSWSLTVHCGTEGDIVRGRCEGEPALYALTGASDSQVSCPSFGFFKTSSDYEVRCEEGPWRNDRGPLHSRGGSVGGEGYGPIGPCDGQQFVSSMPPNYYNLQLDIAGPDGGDYQDSFWANHMAGAPLYCNPNHCIGMDVYAIGAENDGNCYDCSMRSDAGNYGCYPYPSDCVGGGFSVTTNCPLVDGAGGWADWRGNLQNNCRDSEDCQPNNGCFVNDCDDDILSPAWGLKIGTTTNWGDYRDGYCGRWNSVKRRSLGSVGINANNAPEGLPDPIIIPPTGNCAIRIKTCTKSPPVRITKRYTSETDLKLDTFSVPGGDAYCVEYLQENNLLGGCENADAPDCHPFYTNIPVQGGNASISVSLEDLGGP